MTRFTTIRYGHMRLRGLFSVETEESLVPGDWCIVRSPRGQELGTVLAHPVGDGDPGKAGCGSGACGSCASSQGVVLRRASDADRDSFQELVKSGTRSEVMFARRRARDLGLDMQVADAEYLLGREKLIIHFTAENRIDFRELVRDLAKEFSTRIELKQVGARDEARLVGDVATCGRELCCRTFLHDLQPVSMRMAKQQKKTLDPTKISGQCGKLKCCLRYEDEVYVELQKTLPRKNSWVLLEAGVAKVLSIDLLLQKMVVDLDGKRELVHVSECLETGLKPPRPGEKPVAPAGARRAPATPARKRVTPLKVPRASAPPIPSTVPEDATPAPEATKETPSAEATPKSADEQERGRKSSRSASRGPRGERDRKRGPRRERGREKTPDGEESTSRSRGGRGRGSREERRGSGDSPSERSKGNKRPSGSKSRRRPSDSKTNRGEGSSGGRKKSGDGEAGSRRRRPRQKPDSSSGSSPSSPSSRGGDGSRRRRRRRPDSGS